MSDDTINKDNTNFRAEDIKKKDIDFTIEKSKSEKRAEKTKKFNARLSANKQKFLAHPLIKGKAKYATLSTAIILIAAGITLPIVLPGLLRGEDDPEPIPEEELTEEERNQIRKDTVDLANNIDPDANDDTQATILADLDAKIAAANAEDRPFFIQSKAYALQQFGRLQEALDLLEPLVEERRSARDWGLLPDLYSFVSGVYENMGNIEEAIKWMQGAIDVLDEAANDPVSPVNLPGAASYTSRLNRLKNSR